MSKSFKLILTIISLFSIIFLLSSCNKTEVDDEDIEVVVVDQDKVGQIETEDKIIEIVEEPDVIIKEANLEDGVVEIIEEQDVTNEEEHLVTEEEVPTVNIVKDRHINNVDSIDEFEEKDIHVAKIRAEFQYEKVEKGLATATDRKREIADKEFQAGLVYDVVKLGRVKADSQYEKVDKLTSLAK